MIVHSYNRFSGEYVGSEECDPDPLTPGEFLQPAHSTVVEPPTCEENEKAFWAGTHWIVMPIIPQLPTVRHYALVKNSRVLCTLEFEGSAAWGTMPGCFMIEDAKREARPGCIFDGTSFGVSDGLDFA